MNWRLLICLVIIFDLLVWAWVIINPSTNVRDLELYFLDVGQGDSELISVGGVDILVDGGPDSKILESLSKVLPITDRYLDLVILTHPHLDHFGGLIDVLKNYQIGVLLDSGFTHDIATYQYFKKEIIDNNIQQMAIREGDKIIYQDLELDFISPAIDAKPAKAKDLHDNTLIFLLKKKNFKGLFTGDINFKVENLLIKKYPGQLVANLLKVSHHGSAKSTSDNFLSIVRPQISIIEVGKNNPYGHPKPVLLERLKKSSTKIFRTDQDGTVKLYLVGSQLRVFKTK